MKYSQNNEQEYILDYFRNNYHITLLDIGANDGRTFSNSLALIERGASAVLVEPSPTAFEMLQECHRGKKHDVLCIRAAIGKTTGRVTLHESGPHLPNQKDKALLSSVSIEETERWRGYVGFKPVEVDMITVKDLQQLTGVEDYDFITIDAEGLDLEILKQIDLSKTRLVCIEFNSKPAVAFEIKQYCAQFGLTNMLYLSGENIIIGR